ncbi:hypothetical protein GHT07_16705 [Caenimonas koreensis DSM 17982]|uniref:Uncharacterized protein n=1 Tax=Caenimonas koreensis DSM 17982 TaxID=1121255 RepID=A0A844AWN6_9BURK|nr:hypothetical protein [Caenimonas koreensis]MRD48930.1 hypothetical protein [Caenimonas koreensis DSM 17982]
MKTLQQLSIQPTRTAARGRSMRVAATVVANQIAFACGLESFGMEPWNHGYRDPHQHPGQQDV